MPLVLVLGLAIFLFHTAGPQAPALACEFCLPESAGPMGPSGPNTYWLVEDNVWVCPAGDSVVAGIPSKLRIEVWYADANCLPKVGVPPDSIWVTYSTITGNLAVNDKGVKVFADDSTDACGHTRITIASFSGCGTLRLRLNVSGIGQGTKLAVVNSLDQDASGRLGTIDLPYCDPRPQPQSDHAEIFAAHYEHWHRNALHGTLVRRTNYLETIPEYSVGTIGTGAMWSPSQRFLAHTAFVDAGPGEDPSCKVFLVPSDPAQGNALLQFTSDPISKHDYTPSFSPLNTEIIFDRADREIIRKPVPWAGSSTEIVVTTSNNPGCSEENGDAIPAYSPDGQWVAFSRCNGSPTGGWSLWKIPTVGGTAIQLTSAAPRADFFAHWSPDGQWILFQRQDALTFGDDRYTVWRVPASGGPEQQVFIPPGSPAVHDAVQPAHSPDGSIVVAGYGKRDNLERNVIARTLDPTLLFPNAAKMVANYPDSTYAAEGDFPVLYPRISPDGTRLALGSKQVWAVRRNMNLPPRFTSVTSGIEGTRAIADTAATMGFQFNTLETGTITVLATDPEGNALTYRASFLQTWMTWNPLTRTLSGEPAPGTEDQTFFVKFWVTTASGGTDSFIAAITVKVPLAPLASRSGSRTGEESGTPDVPNTAGAGFYITVPMGIDGTARLSIFDVAGRLVTAMRGRPGQRLTWDGGNGAGVPVSPGIYLWRLEAGRHSQDGRFVMMR